MIFIVTHITLFFYKREIKLLNIYNFIFIIFDRFLFFFFIMKTKKISFFFLQSIGNKIYNYAQKLYSLNK